jgi:hypothetical protein
MTLLKPEVKSKFLQLFAASSKGMVWGYEIFVNYF